MRVGSWYFTKCMFYPDFTVSEYCSSCNYLFCGPILIKDGRQAGRQDGMPKKDGERNVERKRPKKREFHELLYTEISNIRGF